MTIAVKLFLNLLALDTIAKVQHHAIEGRWHVPPDSFLASFLVEPAEERAKLVSEHSELPFVLSHGLEHVKGEFHVVTAVESFDFGFRYHDAVFIEQGCQLLGI